MGVHCSEMTLYGFSKRYLRMDEIFNISLPVPPPSLGARQMVLKDVSFTGVLVVFSLR
jgi:hypothetical protein